MPDHVHILLKLDSKIAIGMLLKHIKGKSSRWLTANYPFLENFQWQRGYGAFSVSSSQVATVVAYIKNQKQHHQEESLQSEFEIL